MPPWVGIYHGGMPPWVGIYHGRYASLYTLYMPPCVYTVYIASLYMYRSWARLASCHVVNVNVSFVRRVKEARVLPKERCLLHPENKPSSLGKPPHYGKETRHRKHPCTRSLGISQPLNK